MERKAYITPPAAEIHALTFYILGDAENQMESMVTVTSKEGYKGEYPIAEGLYDDHMGTTDYAWTCGSCGRAKGKCPGHCGLMSLNYPVKSPLFRDQLLKWLRIICRRCYRPISNIDSRGKNKTFGLHLDAVKRSTQCHHCGMINPEVTRDKTQGHIFYINTPASGRHEKHREKLLPHEIRNIVDSISDRVVVQMGRPLRSHPRKMILTKIRVPPNTIRPDTRRTSGKSGSNDVTILLRSVFDANAGLPTQISDAGMSTDLIARCEKLDAAYFELVKGAPQSATKSTSVRTELTSLAKRLPDKSGQIRHNLLGRRAHFMLRSVITGDPRLRIDEVGLPELLARTIQIPEVVRSYNRARLEVYFRNGIGTYPGCSSIQKISDGKTYKIEFMDKSYKLQDGDIVFRDIIDGDAFNFNRPPSLWYASIACHKVVVMPGNTLRMNVVACQGYNADFDGDAMGLLVPRNIISRTEIKRMSYLGNWMISYKNSMPIHGTYQDSLIGATELSRSGVKLNKWAAMSLFARVDQNIPLEFTKQTYTSRELISMILPPINLQKYAQYYSPQYAGLLPYNPDDIKVVIQSGKLISGILDKSTVGQAPGSIFHIIHNEYGSRKALDIIYCLQQMTANYFLFRGFTCGMRDFRISQEAKSKVEELVRGMFIEWQTIRDRKDSGLLVPPLGVTLASFYEDLLSDSLEAGSEFIKPILRDIDFDNNGVAKLVLHGSRGKMTNLTNILSAIGKTTINGRRFRDCYSHCRSSPYFSRYDDNPKALGYIPQSYVDGISPDVFPFIAAEARQGVISIALFTSVTGHQNRISVKNLESNIIDNLRKVSKQSAIIQLLYADGGFDPRKIERVTFPTVAISDAEMRKFHASVDSFPRDDVPEVVDLKAAFADEFDQLLADREQYRQIILSLEMAYPNLIVFSDSRLMPINIDRIIADIMWNTRARTVKTSLNPISAIARVKRLCADLPYTYHNEIQKKLGRPMPQHFITATLFTQILIRSKLCVAQLVAHGVGDIALDSIILNIESTYQRSLIDYGTAIGIIAAQCVSEPLSQMSLDSKHRAGAGGESRTNPVARYIEILSVRPTAKMKNPSMLLIPRADIMTNRTKVQEVSNNMEMMKFERFIQHVSIFFEEFGHPIHSKYKHESKMIASFLLVAGQEPPPDLIRWCIRFELNLEEMTINNIRLENIITALRLKFPGIFPVYTPENSPKIIIRCYFRGSSIRPSTGTTYEAFMIKELLPAMRDVVIRGISGVTSSRVIEIVRTIANETGELKAGKIFAINTQGTNLELACEDPDIDPLCSQSDSIAEFEQMFGVAATRNKIILELRKILQDVNVMHCAIYADEMTFSGQVTSIQKNGMQKREASNICLRLSFQSSLQVIEEAAVHNLTDRISGVSGALITGSAPRVGTRYNRVVVDEDFVKKYLAKQAASIDELL